jgi:hypothetical protein
MIGEPTDGVGWTADMLGESTDGLGDTADEAGGTTDGRKSAIFALKSKRSFIWNIFLKSIHSLFASIIKLAGCPHCLTKTALCY